MRRLEVQRLRQREWDVQRLRQERTQLVERERSFIVSGFFLFEHEL